MIIRTKTAAALTGAVLTAALAVGSIAAAYAAPTEGSGTTQAVQQLTATASQSFSAFDANQAVAIDDSYFYAINNRSITKHDRKTGEAVLQFAGSIGGPLEHLDSGVVVKDKLYAVHSNYPEWPMESSIEIFDTKTMEHVGTHSFGIYRGSLTWLDYHDGAWWAAFANYNQIVNGKPYGETYNTQVVKMGDDFQVTQSWTIPKAILDKFGQMSNSGGSWGPDGRLYLTGHDLAETYVMNVPKAGGELEWAETISVPGIEGQGIAWDRSKKESPTLWGISRKNDLVQSFKVPTDQVTDPDAPLWEILGPGEFRK